MFRYLALIWNAECVKSSASAENLERRIRPLSPSWEVILRTAGVAVLVADRTCHFSAQALPGAGGVILGEIFPRLNPSDEGAAVGLAKFDASETRAAIGSQCRTLASRYWGDYIAFILDADRGARYFFKAPCGSLPCHFTEHGGVQLIFSCLGDCRELGLRFPVNWTFVRKSIASGSREVREPSLLGVSTVYRGECIRFNREARLESRSGYWQPDFAAVDLVEPDVAQQMMRATVLSCVHSLAMGHESVLAQVSGGLDSSIVLGCLGAMTRRPQITCYTLFMPNSVCDERRWARQVARPFGYRQIEAPLEPEKLVYANLPALGASVEPASYFTRWQKGPVERELAARYGAAVMFNGEGGDAVFCSTSYVFAVDHCLRRYGLSFRTLRTAAQVARRRDRTVWNILGKALAREMLGESTHDRQRTLEPFSRLVSSEVREASSMNLETLLRMGPLAFALNFYDASASHHDAAPYAASPLCSQPVVELCARIPVDVHFADGRNRGLARRAFAAEVPEPILRRQWKDRPLLQLGEVIALNLPFIREHLLEGRLVKERLLNRAAVEQALSDGPTRSGAIGSEILMHLDLELWIRDLA
jgi:asparagine synthase (glutamine-hydrolysing)